MPGLKSSSHARLWTIKHLLLCREEMDVENVSERHAHHWELNAVSDHDVNEAAHYCRYAFAAYGYLLYIWAQPQYKYAAFPESSR